jgi:hypothetical protein
LQQADAVFILGSTEPHYTPSKTYQAVLSQRPIWAILHEKSTASQILTTTKAGIVLTFNGEEELSKITLGIKLSFNDFLKFRSNYSSSQVDLEVFDEFSARNVSKKLVEFLDRLC